MISISEGNMKMGGIPSFSTLPGRDCIAACKKTCYKYCYARMMSQRRENIFSCWRRNSTEFRRNPSKVLEQIYFWIKFREPRYFRWNVGGDIIDYRYFNMMKYLAWKFPETRFLCFTKKYELTNLGTEMPRNLNIFWSAWPGIELPMCNRGNFPIAWLIHPKIKDKRMPDNISICKGSCVECKDCFTKKKSVAFKLHGSFTNLMKGGD